MAAPQASLFEPEPVETTPARIELLASFLSGWKWPGQGSYRQLSAKRREAAERAAREVFRFLDQGDD